MPKYFWLGVMAWASAVITLVVLIVYYLTSPPRKRRSSKGRHLRRRGDDDTFMKNLVRKYQGSDIKNPRSWTQKLPERHVTDKL